MKITAIKPAVKTAGRWNIFVDGAYSFSLDESQLLEHKLKLGQEIDEAVLAVLQDDSAFGKAYARALELIFRRLRSKKELHDYARRKAWDEALTKRVIERLEVRGYLDDTKFAESWVRSRETTKPSSRKKLQLELRQKGVANEIIETVLGSESEHNELETLHQIVAKKRRRYSDEQKLMAYLARQGFRFDDIKQVLSEAID